MNNRVIIFFLILVVFFCTGYSESVTDIFVSYQPNVDRLETIFKTYLPSSIEIVYTKVPRGLIISINEDCFFNDGEARIKESSLIILDTISAVISKLSNYCIVENHTEANNLKDSYYDENWELSLVRADNIIQYMILYGKVPSEKLFALGYGEFMPFKDNVAPLNKQICYNPDKRIDFVILEYEAKR